MADYNSSNTGAQIDAAVALANAAVPKVAMTDNAIPIADGTSGELETTGVIIDGNDRVYGAGVLANIQTGTAYTLALIDRGKLVTLSNSSAVTLTIPANASVVFPVGTVINFIQLGSGQVTFEITTDTMNSSGDLVKLTGQYAAASLIKIAATTWVLIGDLSA